MAARPKLGKTRVGLDDQIWVVRGGIGTQSNDAQELALPYAILLTGPSFLESRQPSSSSDSDIALPDQKI
jgi:hypothetical protein